MANCRSIPHAAHATGSVVISNLDFYKVDICPCFTPGTAIATVRGEVAVEALKVGDLIITRDNGLKPIEWIGSKSVSTDLLLSNPYLEPVLIKKGALGHDLPERDLIVSQNHRMLVTNDRVALSFAENEVLVAAKRLVSRSGGIEIMNSPGTTYLHFMFDSHEVVLANGVWTESFQPDDTTLGALGNAQRNEIFELFPDLKKTGSRESFRPARLVVDH